MQNQTPLQQYNLKDFNPHLLAIQLSDYVEAKVILLPAEERMNITAQIRSSANSIAERVRAGVKKHTRQGRAYEFSTAIGSAHETANWALIANKLGYWKDETEKYITDKAKHIVAILTKILIRLVETHGKITGVVNPRTKDVRDLKAYQKGLILLKKTYDTLENVEKTTTYSFSLKVKKQGCSILANLAESNVPYTGNRIKRLYDVKAALENLQHHLEDMVRRGQVDERTYNEMYQLSNEISRITNKIISNLASA